MKYISKTVYHKVGMRKIGYPEAGIKWKWLGNKNF